MGKDREKPIVQNYFNQTAAGLYFETPQWSIKSDQANGWTSLKALGSEFLYSEAGFGAMVFKRGDEFVTRFPEFSNLSSDSSIGRIGNVADGMYLIRVEPNWTRPEFQFYMGFNDPADRQAVLWLGDDVSLVRLGNAGQLRNGLSLNVSRHSKEIQSGTQAVVVHKTGYALVVQSLSSPPPAISAGMVKDPTGRERLALTFPCKGFAANVFNVVVEPYGLADNFVLNPRFNVISSDDPKLTDQAPAANGVTNPVYGKETQAKFSIQTGWLGDGVFNGYAELEIVHALGKPHFHERVELTNAKPDAQGIISAAFHPRFSMPGISEVWGRLIGSDGRLLWVDRYRMAYDWENFKPHIHVQPDMRTFWDKTLEELRKRPLDAKCERVKEFEDHPKFEIYTVHFNSWDGKRIYALFYVPKERKLPLPAIVAAHPGVAGFALNKRADGVYGSEVGQDSRFVTIIPLIRGHKPDAKDIPFNHPWWGPLGDRDSYVARSWYCAMTRSVDFLISRPDLADPKAIVATGGSQGGALALITVALDSRVKYCFADCPANCQLHESIEHYPTFGPSKNQAAEGQSIDDLKKMLSYYNPVNFCPWIKCPTYIGVNIGDMTVHSMGPLAAFQNLTGLKTDQKAFYPGYPSTHGSGPGLARKEKEIMNEICK